MLQIVPPPELAKGLCGSWPACWGPSLDGRIKIAVITGLLTLERVYASPAVDPEPDPEPSAWLGTTR